MTEKQFKIVVEDSSLVDMPIFMISNSLKDVTLYEDKEDTLEFCKWLNSLIEENKELKAQLNDLQTFDDEDFIEIEHINNIYKKLGFQGVIDYAKGKLQHYGAVREVEKGLWVMVTGGWSDNEFWLDCLNSFVSMFAMKHYCAYERGGAFYYTEKPHDKIEIRLKKGDVE